MYEKIDAEKTACGYAADPAWLTVEISLPGTGGKLLGYMTETGMFQFIIRGEMVCKASLQGIVRAYLDR